MAGWFDQNSPDAGAVDPYTGYPIDPTVENGGYVPPEAGGVTGNANPTVDPAYAGAVQAGPAVDASAASPSIGGTAYEQATLAALAASLPGGMPTVPTQPTVQAQTLDHFNAPTYAELTADPGYQAGWKLQQQALEQGAAAKGTLLSGGTQQSLSQAAQDYGSTKYGDMYNRALAAYQAAISATSTNNAGTLNAANLNANNAQTGYTNQVGQITTPYQMLMGSANTGLTAASTAANLGANYSSAYANTQENNAANIGNLYTQQGNSAAASTVGSANAWNSGLGTLANDAISAYYNSLFKKVPFSLQ